MEPDTPAPTMRMRLGSVRLVGEGMVVVLVVGVLVVMVVL